MLSTAVALIAVRYRSLLLSDPQLNWIASALLAIAFGVVSFAAVLGTFVNKVAPLE
jgi:hypothetical protein